MKGWEFIVLICAGVGTIISVVKIIVGAAMQKKSNEIKMPCQKEFDKIDLTIENMEKGARESKEKIIRMETKFDAIMDRLARLEKAVDGNIAITNQIYADMPKRASNGGRSKQNQ